ncbi:MAG: secretin and TonB N-terminal domain-containing protein [Candidatus Omnitrophica bacterium]|nr:secretin and TonB N-terminal domain-containing protein [Candidatus Omnitrophota bacterium]
MRRQRWWIGALLGCCLVAPSLLRAQEDVEVSPEAETREDAAGAASESPASAAAVAAAPVSAPSEAGLITLDFKDADIRQVLRVLSLKSGVDIVASPDVESLVSIKLTNVPWEQALDIILRTYGFAYERKDKVIRVMTQEAVEQEALATEVFPLNYAKAADVSKVIEEMLSERGKAKFDERTNTLIVTDLPSNLFQLRSVITRLDQATAQVHIESRFVETRLTRDENLGFDWSDSMSMTWTLPQVTGTIPLPRRLQSVSAAADGAVTLGTLNPGSLNTVINVLKSRVETRVISNPTIVTLDNKEASVQVGTDVNIPNFQIDPSTGRATVTGFQTRSTGILLKVTPHINLQGEIVLDVKPEITSVGTDRTFAQGITFPDFDVQKAQTQVRLLNGQTLAIGGLKRQAERVTLSKVPILGDVPILGWFFTNRREQTPSGQDQLDLLIFLTVHLVTQGSPQAVVAAQPPSAP